MNLPRSAFRNELIEFFEVPLRCISNTYKSRNDRIKSSNATEGSYVLDKGIARSASNREAGELSCNFHHREHLAENRRRDGDSGSISTASMRRAGTKKHAHIRTEMESNVHRGSRSEVAPLTITPPCCRSKRAFFIALGSPEGELCAFKKQPRARI